MQRISIPVIEKEKKRTEMQVKEPTKPQRPHKERKKGAPKKMLCGSKLLKKKSGKWSAMTWQKLERKVGIAMKDLERVNIHDYRDKHFGDNTIKSDSAIPAPSKSKKQQRIGCLIRGRQDENFAPEKN